MPRGSADDQGVSDEHDSRSIRFDPSRVEDLIDGAKAGRYDDASKKAAITKHCSDPGLNRFVRGWMRHGVPVGGVRVKDWYDADYREVKHALRSTYPQEDPEDMASADLESFMQQSRFDPHIAEYFQLKRGVGEPVDIESGSRKLMNDIVDTLSETMDTRYQRHDEDSFKSAAREEIDSGALSKVKHLCKKLQQLDKMFYARGKRAGVPQGAYWIDHLASQPARRGRKKDVNINAVDDSPDSMDRILRLEQRVVDVEASVTTSQTNTTSAISTLKADLEKRMTLQESKTRNLVEKTHDVRFDAIGLHAAVESTIALPSTKAII